MKMFGWINGKVSKSQASHGKGQSSIHCTSQRHGSSSSAVDVNASAAAKSDPKSAFSVDEQAASWREIVKIFVNYEEYGLLAIGTLGYDPTGGVEPEFELFEVRQGALEGVTRVMNSQSQSQIDTASTATNSSINKEQSEVKEREQDTEGRELVLHGSNSARQATKKVFPSDGLATHIPHITAGFLKSSKLADRLLHPLSYLRSSRNSCGPLAPLPQDASAASDKKKKKIRSVPWMFKALVSKGQEQNSSGSSVGMNKNKKGYVRNSKKQITNDDVDLQSYSNGMTNARSSERKKKKGEDEESKWKTKVLHKFYCASGLNLAEDDDGRGGDIYNSAASAIAGHVSLEGSREGDTKECHRKEYRIRTESDYVVLEL